MQRRNWSIWCLLLGLVCWTWQPVSAQDDIDFGEATEEAAEDDLFGGDDEAMEDEAPAEATEEVVEEDDLFGGDDNEAAEGAADDEVMEEETVEEAGEAEPADEGFDFGDAAEAKPADAAAARPQAEVKAALVEMNDAIGKQYTTFVERNKELAKAAVQAGDAEELMPIVREYGPAVIGAKQAWITLVGNPAKYDTWIGSPGYQAAWRTFGARWQALQQYPKRFAAVDIDLADKLTDELAKLGASFQEYSDLSDEWDGKLGNEPRNFAFNGDEAPADDDVEAVDFGDDEEEMPADFDEVEAEDEVIEQDEMEEDAEVELPADEGAADTIDQDDADAADGEKEDDAFDFGDDAAEEEMPAEEGDEPATEEAADDDDLFGSDEEPAAEEEMEEEPADAEGDDDADDLFGDGN